MVFCSQRWCNRSRKSLASKFFFWWSVNSLLSVVLPDRAKRPSGSGCSSLLLALQSFPVTLPCFSRSQVCNFQLVLMSFKSFLYKLFGQVFEMITSARMVGELHTLAMSSLVMYGHVSQVHKTSDLPCSIPWRPTIRLFLHALQICSSNQLFICHGTKAQGAPRLSRHCPS